MSLLVCGDVIQPSLGWLMTPGTPRDLVTEIADTHGRRMTRVEGDGVAIETV